MAYAKPQRELALALLSAGSSVTAVAKQVGVSRRTVQRWREGLPTAQRPSSSEQGSVAPELTLAAIAVDDRMPAGARVQAAKALIEVSPHTPAATMEPEEMTEYECFEVSIMAGTVYAAALLEGRHQLSPKQVEELESSLDDLRKVLG